MSAQRVTLIDHSRQIVATAHVSEQSGYFAGLINLSCMPATLQQKFAEYEEIVQNQMFSLLDEIEEKIENLALKVIFEDGREIEPTDLQIYPKTKKVSFKVLEGVASLPDRA